MDRADSERDLRRINGFIARCARDVRRQQEIVYEAEACGQDASLARQILMSFEETLRRLIEGREQFLGESGSIDAAHAKGRT
jgi:hypothetical protein